eukprot:6209809-Pleurochrysis_carterae.AAC.1
MILPFFDRYAQARRQTGVGGGGQAAARRGGGGKQRTRRRGGERRRRARAQGIRAGVELEV